MIKRGSVLYYFFELMFSPFVVGVYLFMGLTFVWLWLLKEGYFRE